MKISFQYRLKLSAETLAVIEELSFHTTKINAGGKANE